MKKQFVTAVLATLFLAGGFLNAQTEDEAVLVRMDDDTQQVRVEAFDGATGRWLAIASGYRDSADAGWLKIALPDGHATSTVRVMANSEESPFAGKWQSASIPDEVILDYPPTKGGVWATLDDTTGAPESRDGPVIEEADIWAWDQDTLYFYNQYRGLQVIDMSNPTQPDWQDYFRYPAKGEDLYSLGKGDVVLIGSGNYWQGQKLTLQFLNFDGTSLSLEDSVQLGTGYYMDSRRYGDYLYVMTREWISQLNPDGTYRNAPLIKLYTVSLSLSGEERVVDVQSFESKGWLDAVLTAQPDGILLSLNTWDRWSPTGGRRWASDVHVLVPSEDGIPVTAGVARLAGVLRDKFKMHYKDGVLTTVSQQADWSTGQFTRSTMLENFSLTDGRFKKIGELALAPGETLFATRFYGDNVYVVTFLRVDPLFSVDNSEKTHPVVAGELEIPGWSNYIEWVDDYLFAVGIEESKVTVSTFDVSNPANMSMKDRVFLNEDSWAWSEAQYDDQAISFYPGSNILMLPFTTWSYDAGEMVQAMQLISWESDGMLSLRGQIHHLDVPRRGVLKNNIVVTVSGRELLTSNVSDLDNPQEGGSTTLAWNVQNLIPHGDYLLQLETAESDYFYWRGPYSSYGNGEPLLFITLKDTPNMPEKVFTLENGRLLGVSMRGNQLILLQDVTEVPEESYWELPENQDLAVRVYDLTDPLAPVLQNEVTTTLPYMGNAFDAIQLSGNYLLWRSEFTPMYWMYAMTDAIWPGPMYGGGSQSFWAMHVGVDGTVDPGKHHALSGQDYWYAGNGWLWEEPLLVTSHTKYEEIIHPDTYTRYKAKTRLVAFDFSVPEDPVELPNAPLPGELTDLKRLDDDGNHFLYFEKEYMSVDVWGWDTASVFPLFKQKFPASEPEYISYSRDWLAPFHVRIRNLYKDQIWENTMEVWIHRFDEDRFERILQYPMENTWVRSTASFGDTYLMASELVVNFFDTDEQAGTFSFVQSTDIPFPNLYSADLGKAVLDVNALYLPSGIYGVDILPMETPFSQAVVAMEAMADSAPTWRELTPDRWSRTSKSSTDTCGSMSDLQWLYSPDTWPLIDDTATDLGDMWRDSTWFGQFLYSSTHPKWVFHTEHRELFFPHVEDSSPDGLIFFDVRLGYLWTNDVCYPFVYIFEQGEWAYYVPGTGLDGQRWFYGFGSGWFSR